MNILLTNDDGYNEPRLKILKNELEKYGTVYVSAPKRQMSGASVSLTINKDIEFIEVDDKTIIVDGTPADSTSVGLSRFKNTKFDLVVSGVNKGHNEAENILFSGTIGAAMIGVITGINGIALSAEDDDLEILKNKTEYILSFVFEKELYKSFKFLNINYPHKNFNEGKGIKVGRAYSSIKGEPLIMTSPTTYKTPLLCFVEDNNIDSDRYLTNNGYYSITPLKPSYMDDNLLDELEEII